MRFARSIAALWAVVLLSLSGSLMAAEDASLATGRNFAPFVLQLKPSLQMSPLPGWMQLPAVVHEETATIEIPLPALWQAPSAEYFAMTVVFRDEGDGGPAVEWRAANGTTSVISQGLGESGRPVGLNARTVLLPQSITREGGTLLISYYARFECLVSAAVRPARGNLLAILGGNNDPVLVDEALRVFERREVDGFRQQPLTGDLRRGAVVEAELSAAIEPLENELEFVVPIEGLVEGTMIRFDVLGLDPEARVEVRVNSLLAGTLNFPPFRLDDPSVVPDGLGRLVVAGWRTGTLFVPSRFWLEGENSIVVTLKRSAMETGRPVFLRNAALHLRFGTQEAGVPPEPDFLPPEPDLTLPDPLLPDPDEIPLPEIITGVR